MSNATSQSLAAAASAPDDKESMNQFSQRARSGFLWMGGSTLILQIVSWMFTLLTARLLAPTDYGMMALAETIIPYFSLISTFSLPTWMIQSRELNASDREAMFSLSAILGMCMMLLAMIVAPFIAQFYGQPQFAFAFQLLSVTLLLSSLQSVPSATLQRELRLKPIALLNLVVGISRGALTLTLAFMGCGYWALLTGLIFHECAALIWMASAAGLPRRFGWNSNLISQALKFGAAATGAHFLWFIFSTSDNVAVGKLFSIETLGIYAMAFFLTDLPMSKLSTMLRPVIIPYFSRLRGSKEQFAISFLRVTRSIAGLIFPILVGLAVVAPEAVSVILGAKWSALVVPLQAMCLIGIIRGITSNVEPLLIAVGEPQRVLRINAFRAIILPPAFFALGYLFGLPGIYAAWILVFPLTSYRILALIEGICGVKPISFLLNLRGPMIAAFVMGLVVIFAFMPFESSMSHFVSLALKISVGAMTYFAVLFLFFRSETMELVRTWRELKGGAA